MYSISPTLVKNLFLSLFVVFAFLPSYSQIIANDDSGTINGIPGGYLQYGVLHNDSLNGGTVTTNQVAINTISTTCPCLTLDSFGAVYLAPGTPPGSHTITYGICEIANPTNCDTAIITVNVCDLAPPTISNIVQPGCSSNGIVSFSGLPSGVWQIRVSTGGGSSNYIVSGSQPSAAVIIPNYNTNYGFTLISGGCQSEEIYFSPDPPYSMLLAGTAAYSDYNADGFVNAGDIVNFQFSVTNTGICTLENVQMEPYPGYYTITGGPIASLAAGATDNTTLTGTHVLTQDDITFQNGFGFFGANGSSNGNVVAWQGDYSIPNNLGISDGIRLNAFIDTNGNNIQDIGEQSFSYGHFAYEMNNSGEIRRVYSDDGTFILYENNAANTFNLTYSVDINLVNNCMAQYVVNPSSYSNITIANGSGITTYNFPITLVPCVDTAVYLTPHNFGPRPGFSHDVLVSFTNYGNQTIPSGTITFTKDSNLTITSTTPAVTMTGTGFTYNFSNLQPNQWRDIVVTMQTPNIPIVSLGDLTTNFVTMSITPGDSNVSNNSDILIQDIRGSYDPNEKTESHGGRIVHSSFTSNDYLTYTILFENTGSASAINVRVTDVLDAKLDENSVAMVRSSHPYVLERSGGNLTWNFDAIELPPSNGSSIVGHGFITFRVKPKAGYLIGDVIPNTANIYFDFNPPIVTDPCLTEFVQSLASNSNVFRDFEFYPNPVKNLFTVSNSLVIDSVEISSVLGQKVRTIKIDDLQAQIDFSGLTNGIYFVKVTSENQGKTIKIIKD